MNAGFMALLMAFSMLGCTTMATVAPGATTGVVDQLKEGDRVSVRTTTGWYEDLRVVDVDAARIRAERSGEPMTVARDDILEIQVPRGAPGKAAALAAGIYFLSLYALCGNPFRENVVC